MSLRQVLLSQVLSTPFDGSVSPLFVCIFNMLGRVSSLMEGHFARHLARDLCLHAAPWGQPAVTSTRLPVPWHGAPWNSSGLSKLHFLTYYRPL